MNRLLILALLSVLLTSCGSKSKDTSAVIANNNTESEQKRTRRATSTSSSDLSAAEGDLAQLGVRAIAYPHIKRYMMWRIRGHKASNTPSWWSRSCDKSIHRAKIENGEIKSHKKLLFVFKLNKDVKEKCLPSRFLVPTKKNYCKRLKGMTALGVVKDKKFLSRNELEDVRSAARRFIDMGEEYIAQPETQENCIDQQVVAEKIKLLEQAFGVRDFEETEEL